MTAMDWLFVGPIAVSAEALVNDVSGATAWTKCAAGVFHHLERRVDELHAVDAMQARYTRRPRSEAGEKCVICPSNLSRTG